MVSRDYRKELGLPSAQKTVPKSVAVAAIALIGVGAWFFARTIVASSNGHEAPAAVQAASHH